MKAIVLPRLGGKTQRMLRWLISDSRHVLIVHSYRERDRLVRLFTQDRENPAPDEINRIVSLSDVTRGMTRGRWQEPIYGIDELDHVLFQLFLGPVAVVSFTGEVEA